VPFVPEEVMNKMQAAGVAAGIVQTTEEMVNDPQLKHREHFEISKHPEAGSITCENPAFQLSKCKARWPRPAPCLGEHNEFVYTKLLGIPDEEFAQLLNDGVFE
jgi:benzylsuccinate CoA-transferase BbsF subunit